MSQKEEYEIFIILFLIIPRDEVAEVRIVVSFYEEEEEEVL